MGVSLGGSNGREVIFGGWFQDGSGVEGGLKKGCIVMFFILFVGFELCFGVLEGSCLSIALFFAP